MTMRLTGLQLLLLQWWNALSLLILCKQPHGWHACNADSSNHTSYQLNINAAVLMHPSNNIRQHLHCAQQEDVVLQSCLAVTFRCHKQKHIRLTFQKPDAPGHSHTCPASVFLLVSFAATAVSDLLCCIC